MQILLQGEKTVLQTPAFKQFLESSLGVVPSRVGLGSPLHLTTQLAPGYFLESKTVGLIRRPPPPSKIFSS